MCSTKELCSLSANLFPGLGGMFCLLLSTILCNDKHKQVLLNHLYSKQQLFYTLQKSAINFHQSGHIIIIIKIPNNAHHPLFSIIILRQTLWCYNSTLCSKVKLSNFGRSSIYCSSSTGPESFDFPMHRICITEMLIPRALRNKHLNLGSQGVFFASATNTTK